MKNRIDWRVVYEALIEKGLTTEAEALKQRLNPYSIDSVKQLEELAKKNKITIAREYRQEVVIYLIECLKRENRLEDYLRWFRKRVNDKD
mgnify:CR=1 FL=1